MLKKRLNKWIEGVAPDTPISKVAAETIAPRLEAVDHHLRLAAKQANKSIKYVHQLRVATRRADSALQLFHEVLPDQRRRRLKKQLKHIRRVAGDARDLDVLCERLRHEVENSCPGVLDGIIANLEQRRRRAQRPLIRTWKRAKKRQFRQECLAMVKRIRWRGQESEPTYQQLAVTTLQPLVDQFFQAGEADLKVAENLHELRLAGKRLRYSLELLAAGLHPTIREDVYPVFADIQEILGEINDHVVAKERFECWLVQTNKREMTCAFARFIHLERERCNEARLRFDEWWTPAMVARLKAQFDQALVMEDLHTDLASQLSIPLDLSSGSDCDRTRD